MKLLINQLNVVIEANESIVDDSDKKGFYVEELDTIYPYMLNLQFVETQTELPLDYIAGKYIFENDIFTLNPNYSEPIDVETQLKEQQNQIDELTLAILSMGS